MSAKWMKDRVFYNIYPQSFYDSNGDGIGDLQGIIYKLDYIKDMGFNGIWINPIYESPFRDGGYDVTDFYKVAPRYGTNEDFEALAKECKNRDIKIIVDLVAGHTSTECKWFCESSKFEKNEYSNRYIWTNSVWDSGSGYGGFIGGASERDGCYMKNFFYFQPALNYGFKNVEKDWQLPMDHPDCLKMREELIKIMKFWCGLGADGFRVDMASSLIKNDPEKVGIRELWSYVKKELKKEYPEAILVSEWSYPKDSIDSGFDVDFIIHFNLKAYTVLFRYEKGTNPSDKWIGNSYFRSAGKGDIDEFLTEYLEHYNATKGKGYISIPSGNHDLPRISKGRTFSDLKVAYVFLLTMPGIPFIYYGDEIGMKYIENIPSKEGGYNRTGSRTPMQWDNTKNKGFSASDEPYLPVDNSTSAPTVKEQSKDKNSLLNTVKKLTEIRKNNDALCADGGFEVIKKGYPFVYKRFNEDISIIVAVNPSNDEIELELPPVCNVLIEESIQHKGENIRFNKQSYIIYVTNK
ncbi:MAG: glycosylase [Clostridia bacterium]|nr:glycosylase [Clostridia bacterium]